MQRCSCNSPGHYPSIWKSVWCKVFRGSEEVHTNWCERQDCRNWEKLRAQISSLNPRWGKMVSGMSPARLQDWLTDWGAWIQKHFRIVQWATYTQKNVHKLWKSGIIYNWTFHSPEPRLTQSWAVWCTTRPPIPVPSLLLLRYSSCLQEAAESGTPHHIAPRRTSLLFYVFSGLPQQQQSPMKRTKTTDKKQTNRKRAANSFKTCRVKSWGLQTDSNKCKPRRTRFHRGIGDKSSCRPPRRAHIQTCFYWQITTMLLLLSGHDNYQRVPKKESRQSFTRSHKMKKLEKKNKPQRKALTLC